MLMNSVNSVKTKIKIRVNKKPKPKFAVPNLGAPNRKRVQDRWRKQRGIDNKLRVSKKFHGYKPKIGYKNSDADRYRRARDGVLEVVVHNEKELYALKGRNDVVVRFFHALSNRKKAALTSAAKSNGIRLA